MLLGIIVTELCCSHNAFMPFCILVLVPNSLNKENFDVKKFCKDLVLKVLKWMQETDIMHGLWNKSVHYFHKPCML